MAKILRICTNSFLLLSTLFNWTISGNLLIHFKTDHKKLIDNIDWNWIYRLLTSSIHIWQIVIKVRVKLVLQKSKFCLVECLNPKFWPFEQERKVRPSYEENQWLAFFKILLICIYRFFDYFSWNKRYIVCSVSKHEPKNIDWHLDDFSLL